VIVLAAIATNRYTTAITIAAAVFAAYFAVVYSKHRRAAQGCLVAAAIIAAFDYPKIGPQIPTWLIPLLVLLPTVALGYLMRMWQERAGDSAVRLQVPPGRWQIRASCVPSPASMTSPPWSPGSRRPASRWNCPSRVPGAACRRARTWPPAAWCRRR
jgi:hypothetical protein